ncbi:caldesmon-like [Parasteatoda tepidariorum]|uniref:caldesmon-like n=1 Tax=Parasteatoda tepidariorum TaxID=114398 RepID=UPI00077F90BF|nr:uncharacterized protein LOC107440968 [Parasteatoda tepidariorum]
MDKNDEKALVAAYKKSAGEESSDMECEENETSSEDEESVEEELNEAAGCSTSDTSEPRKNPDVTKIFCRLLKQPPKIETAAFRFMAQKQRERMYENFKKKIEEQKENVEANKKKLLKAYNSFSYLTTEDHEADKIFQNRVAIDDLESD